MHRLRRNIFLLFFWGSCYSTALQAMPDSTDVPPAVQQQWNVLKQKNALADWLYARMAYVEEAPLDRINILVRTPADAWRSYSTYPERLAWFDMLALQGYYQLQAGNILASITAYEHALEFYESYPLPEVALIDDVLKPLGNNYTRLADYDLALNIHRKALALVLAQKDAGNIAAVYSNMAVCARWKGDLAAAITYCRDGLLYSKKGDALHGLLLTTYADILSEQGRSDSARLLCRQALLLLKNRLKEEQAIYWYGSALQLAAAIALQQGQFSTAADYASQATDLYKKYYPDSRQREKAKLDVLRGNIAFGAGKAAEALAFFQQALFRLLPSWHPVTLEEVPQEELLYGENTIGDALEGKANALRATGQQEAALQHLTCSFAAQLKLREQFFYTGSRLREIQVSAGRAAAAMQLAYTLWQQTKDASYARQLLWIAELSKAQVLLDERGMRGNDTAVTNRATDTLAQRGKQLQQAITYYRHELLAGHAGKGINNLLQAAEYELSLLQKKQRQPAMPKLLTLSQLDEHCRQLPQHTILLEFFEGRDSSFLIEADRTGILAVRVIPGGSRLQETIRQFMLQWFTGGPSAMINAPQQFFRECHALYQTIFKNQVWQPGKRYLLVPDGMFSYLPFDALLTNAQYSNNYSSWPYLYKQAMLSKAWSLQTWQQQQAAVYAGNRFSGFFVANAQQSRQPVLAAATEYKQMQQQIRGQFYLDSAASRAAFAAATEQTGILHVSMHATAGVMPYLQLYDGPLFLADLQYTRFTPSLVVLSACRTADGQLLQGEGVNSLERGFVAAGAGGILSGLWNVNDETAVELSQLFYRQLQQQPDAAVALYHARKQWLQLHKEQSLLQLPYYWAGFTYSGHLQKIELPQPHWYWGWVLAITVVLVSTVLLIAILRKRRKRGLL
jgi:CHAT domain-containing protein